MENLDKHYAILGLQRGATQKEIRAAFLQMEKLYHPDQDSSTYAQMRYHEARQAYDALSKATGPKASEQAGRTEKDTPRGAGRYDHDDDELDDIIEDLMKTPEQKDILPTVTLHDYFFRTESIFIVIGSSLLFFMVRRSLLSGFTNIDELSMRFFMHMTVSIFASWLIIGHVRTIYPLRSATFAAVVILGFICGSLYTSFTFRQEFLQMIAAQIRHREAVGFAMRGRGGENLFSASVLHATIFSCVFYFATYLLEATLKRRLKQKRRSRNA